MKKQKIHKAERWDDYDPEEFAEQILNDIQDHMRMSHDLKRALAKSKPVNVKRLRKDWEETSHAQRNLRGHKLH